MKLPTKKWHNIGVEYLAPNNEKTLFTALLDEITRTRKVISLQSIVIWVLLITLFILI